MNEVNERSYLADLEGIKAPLGVILFLIRRDNIDVYDIPIAKITKDYLEYLDAMERQHIELAGEFFVMAATLMRIKAQMLLRRDEGEEDPREELVRNLLEYKKMVEAAKNFKEWEEERRQIFQRPIPQEEKEYRGEPVLDLTLFEVMKAFREIMIEFDASEVREIEREEFSIEDKIELIQQKLEADGQVLFKELFSDSASRMEIIVTFISILELMKRSMIKCKQEVARGEIWVYPGDPDEKLEEIDYAAEQTAAAAPKKGAARVTTAFDTGIANLKHERRERPAPAADESNLIKQES